MTGDIQLDDTTLFHQRLGSSGPPILFMHGGLGLDHAYFRPSLDALSDEFQLIYYDHRGNGRSQTPADWSSVDLNTFVGDAEALMQKLGFDQFILYGHSYGGFIAQEFALRFPKRLKGLILSNTSPNLADYPLEFPSWATDDTCAKFGELFNTPPATDADFRAAWQKILPMYWKDMDTSLSADIDKRTVYRADAWHRASALLGGFQTKGRLKDVSVPSLILGGEFDFITPAKAQEDIHAELPNAQLVIFKDSAHFPIMSKNADYLAAIRNWAKAL